MSDKQAVKPMQDHNWSGDMGDKWDRYLDRFEGMIEPIGNATVDLAACKPGERVIDIGCGGGLTTRQLARQVGPDGQALGLDISPTLVATATARAAAEGLENISFRCGDAATLQLQEAPFDVLFSRFGVMFFEDSVAAFRNMHGMLRPGARVVFCCWGPPPQNPWVSRMMEIVGRHIELPAPDPTAPGPFAFADQDRTRGMLEQAGFSLVHFREWRGTQLLGGPGLDPESAADFSMEAFFVGEVLEGHPQSTVEAVLKDLKELFRECQTPEGIALEAMAWLVTAQA